MNNFISNSLKFTKPDGEIEIKGGLDGDELTLQVRDTGTGIKE